MTQRDNTDNQAQPESKEAGGIQTGSSDVVRNAAEDLRIVGNKGRESRPPSQADAPSPRERKASPAELRRSLWAGDQTTIKKVPQATDKPAGSTRSLHTAPEHRTQDNFDHDAADARTSGTTAAGQGAAMGGDPAPGMNLRPGDRDPVQTVPFPPAAMADQSPYSASPYHEGEPEADHGFLGPIHPLRILRVIRRKWPMMLLVQLIALAGAWFYLSIMPKTYRAVSLIEMSLRRPRIMGVQGAVIEDQGASSAEEVFNTRLARFNGTEMQDLAVSRFKAACPAKGQGDDKLLALMGKISFSLVAKSRLVQITCDNPDRVMAPLAANAFAEAAELYSLEENRIASDKAVAWLDAQSRTQRDLLEKAEQAIAQFRMQNNVDVLENAKKSAEESAVSLGKALVTREGDIILLQDMVRKIDALEIKPETAGGIPDSIPRQAEIKAVLERWAAAVAERDSLLIRYTPQHPEVISRNRVISLLRTQVEDTIKLARATAQSNLELLEKQAVSLRERNTELTTKVAQYHLKIVEATSRLTSLQRERDACDVAYRGILNRIEEARLASDENTATVKTVERAVPPLGPFKPNVPAVFVIAVLAGIAIGMGLGLLSDRLEDRVSSTDDVERRIGLRILGLVPHVPRAMRRDIVMSNLSDKRGHIAEVFAGIRVLLNSRQFADCSDSVLVVSSGPEDGKTVTACNLAIACAQGGSRTLLVDFDLRRPRIGRIFNIPENARCLSEVLTARDSASFPTLPQTTACDNLHVIAAKATPHSNPADIFGSGFVANFVEWARANYDRVIIDSAPFGAVSDCMVLASLVGCVVVVCRPVKTRKQSVRHMVRQLSEVGANIIGAVINDVDFSANPYFSNYYHQYHYNYSYGEHELRKSEPDAPAGGGQN